MKHTPGNWMVYDRRAREGMESALDYRPSYVMGANGASTVACCMGGGPKRAIDKAEERANARLMAAAPDLLAAIMNSDNAHWTPAMRAAMSKALGEEP